MGTHFNPAAFRFLRSLKRNNDRDWFNARKPIFEAQLKAPMLALVAEITDALPPEFARDPAKIVMRLYRDTRFSPNKLPYKTHVAAWWARRGLEKTSGGGFYLQINPDEVLIAAGCYMPEREQLLAIRRHLLDTHTRYRTLISAKKLTAAGMTPLEGVMMTRPPRGFPADHPAIDLIKQRQWGLSASLPGDLALSPTLADQVRTRFKLALPLISLLNEPLVPASPPPMF